MNFTPGDGVVFSADQEEGKQQQQAQHGTVLSIDHDLQTAKVKLNGKNAGDDTIDIPLAKLSHQAPAAAAAEASTAKSQCSGHPYVPTDLDRANFAEQMHSFGWQSNWLKENRCGKWCCYSFECGHITCAKCHHSAVWPTCPQCGRIYADKKIPDTCVGKRKQHQQHADSASSSSHCGADLSSLQNGLHQRFVCSKQIAVQVGPPEKQYVLNPTFCSVFCMHCWNSGDLQHDHNDFVCIDQLGNHRSGVKLPLPSIEKVAALVAQWQQVIQIWRQRWLKHDNTKDVPFPGDEFLSLDLTKKSGEEDDNVSKRIRFWGRLFADDKTARCEFLERCAPKQKQQQPTEDGATAKVCSITYCDIEPGDMFVDLFESCTQHPITCQQGVFAQYLASDERTGSPSFFLDGVCKHPDHKQQ